MDGGPSHYAVLGLDRSFTPAQLKKRYRALALKHHPDRNPGDELAATERFKAVHIAFEVLSDATLRRAYDMELALARARGGQVTPRAAQPPRPPPKRDVRSERAWEEALRSDEFAQRVRKQRQKEEEEAEAKDGEEEADDDATYEDDDEDIAEAVAAVEEAMQREREELEAALRAVEAAEMSPRGGQDLTAVAAERQLEALMELGFHAEQVLPLCDGVSTIEEIIETLMEQQGQ